MGGDKCCGGACSAQGDLCCKNVNGDSFPCQGGGECCGNACAAPGSKCCKPLGPRSAWYPVSEDTPCLHKSTQCRNDQGKKFECAAGDRCCGGACVAHGDACCENACYAPGSKCCWSPWVAKARWYPVTKATKCAFGWNWVSAHSERSARDACS